MMFLSHLQVECKLSRLTISAYKSDLQLYFLFAKEAYQDTQSANNYLVSIASQSKPNTLWRKRAAIVRFFKFLWEEGMVESDLTEQIYKPTTPQDLPKALTYDEITQVLQAAQKNTNTINGQRIYTILTLLYTSAMRVSECIAIELKNIYHDKILITGKRNKQRWVFLTPEVRLLIDEYMKIRGQWCTKNPYLWGINDRKHISRQTVGRWLYQLAAPLGIKISPHVMRHTQATQMLPHMNIIDLAAILGHASVNTTSKYLKVSSRELIDQIKKFHPLSKK